MTFSELTTPGGYKCGEVSSAMQKCIRRGLEEDALFWATELDLAGYSEYVWKRLRIIASEDVGLADNTAAIAVQTLYQSWLQQRKKKDEKHGPERLFLVHAVLILSRAQKSRMVDHALIVMYEAPRTRREIPDFARDRHTAAGRKLRRGWKHFWEHGARLENAAKIPDSFEVIARSTRIERQRELDL